MSSSLNLANRVGPLRVGIGGSVWNGKTALMDSPRRAFRDRYQLAALSNDTYTQEGAEFLTRAGSLAAERIFGIETGGCPHTAIRKDASINLAGIAELSAGSADLDLVLIESGGDKIPRKGGPGIARSDLLVINKIDLASRIGADLAVMERDFRRVRGTPAFHPGQRACRCGYW